MAFSPSSHLIPPLTVWSAKGPSSGRPLKCAGTSLRQQDRTSPWPWVGHRVDFSRNVASGRPPMFKRFCSRIDKHALKWNFDYESVVISNYISSLEPLHRKYFRNLVWKSIVGLEWQGNLCLCLSSDWWRPVGWSRGEGLLCGYLLFSPLHPQLPGLHCNHILEQRKGGPDLRVECYASFWWWDVSGRMRDHHSRYISKVLSTKLPIVSCWYFHSF